MNLLRYTMSTRIYIPNEIIHKLLLETLRIKLKKPDWKIKIIIFIMERNILFLQYSYNLSLIIQEHCILISLIHKKNLYSFCYAIVIHKYTQ